jgi:hypothetical protein
MWELEEYVVKAFTITRVMVKMPLSSYLKLGKK